MTMSDAMEAARKLAQVRRSAVYIVRTGSGFVAQTFADDCVAAVVAVVTAAGDVIGF